MLKDSILHPSGQPSLIAIRELLQLMPCAVVVADAETTEVLATSRVAKELFGGGDDETLYRTTDFLTNLPAREERLAQLQAAPGQPIKVRLELKDRQGNAFTAVGSMVLTAMAGRQVVISTFESDS